MKPLTAAQRLDLVRTAGRPTVNDYIPVLFRDFTELHGDRLCGDDAAIMGGVAMFGDTPVTVLCQVKGRNLEENRKSNFSMPHPEGYRKAMRLAKQAEKFSRPVVCFVDTPGAFCGVEAEKRGQGEAIAKSIEFFMTLRTPVITIILGEGGSGGALAMAVCDELAMLENSLYSVISPRGFSSILWKDPSREKEAADILKITVEELQRFGICDFCIPEPYGGAHNDSEQAAEWISEYLTDAFARLNKTDIDAMLANRYQKFRKIGQFSEQ